MAQFDEKFKHLNRTQILEALKVVYRENGGRITPDMLRNNPCQGKNAAMREMRFREELKKTNTRIRG